MAFDGRLLTLGYASGHIPKIPANLLLVKNFSIHGVFFGNHMMKRPVLFNDSVNAVLKLWTEKKIRPHVGKVFTLQEVCGLLVAVSSVISFITPINVQIHEFNPRVVRPNNFSFNVDC